MSSASGAESGPFFRLLQKVVAVRHEELPAVGWCWVYAFALLAANYILTPIRDQMGVAGGVRNLPWLFVGTLIGTVLINLLFGWVVKKLPRSRFIPLTYRFFALMLLLFGVAMHFATKEQSVWVGRIFFIWVSVANLFAISVFWQLNVDLFSSRPGQAVVRLHRRRRDHRRDRRLGLYRHPRQAGAADRAADLRRPPVRGRGILRRPPRATLAGAARRRPAEEEKAGERPVGGGVLAGIYHTVRSPYLLGVSAFLLLYSVTSTFVYSQQAAIVAHDLTDRAAQTVFFSNINFGVNTVALVLQLFFTGRIVLTLGVALALAILPVITMGGFAVLAMTPTLTVIAVFQVVRRGIEYAVTRPAREVIYTVVSREDRYKSKGFIDTFVYRLGARSEGVTLIGRLRAVEARGRRIPFRPDLNVSDSRR